MIAEYKTKANLGIGMGLACIVIVVVTRLNAGAGITNGLNLLMSLLQLVGLGFWIWGCCMYAKGKGYSAAMGLLGLLSIIGLIILVVLPDKAK